MASVRRGGCATAYTVEWLCAREEQGFQAFAVSALLLLCARSLTHVGIFLVHGDLHT